MMDYIYQATILGMTACIVIALIRMARGPTVLDRVLSFDLITTAAVGIIATLSLVWETVDFVELIMIYALLGFSGSTAFVFYLQRTENRDEPSEPDGKEAP